LRATIAGLSIKPLNTGDLNTLCEVSVTNAPLDSEYFLAVPFFAAGVPAYEVPQHQLERKQMVPVPPCLGGSDVVLYDGLDVLLAIRAIDQVVSHFGCCNLGNVLVLGYGQYLVFGQSAQPDTIFKCQHLSLLSRANDELACEFHLHSAGVALTSINS
jgi:hypothetical protein